MRKDRNGKKNWVTESWGRKIRQEVNIKTSSRWRIW